ncbi:hypothetical protein NDU88_001924 [Pleurodeles waltl]|uniref:Uncharacterized protein n=1 Tax=Pleurodeles waltl TaxID=8319 RepID=A0AAV7WQ44_PLEWA|nr:hypothetical protein NDU88_001924 [Pleurodeles waltl]
MANRQHQESALGPGLFILHNPATPGPHGPGRRVLEVPGVERRTRGAMENEGKHHNRAAGERVWRAPDPKMVAAIASVIRNQAKVGWTRQWSGAAKEGSTLRGVLYGEESVIIWGHSPLTTPRIECTELEVGTPISLKAHRGGLEAARCSLFAC